MRRRQHRKVATLWQLAWEGDRLLCAVYRSEHGLELRLESGGNTVLTEPFDLEPRMLSRARALRQSLVRRGWRDAGMPRQPA
jgi:hypothetical protein